MASQSLVIFNCHLGSTTNPLSNETHLPISDSSSSITGWAKKKRTHKVRCENNYPHISIKQSSSENDDTHIGINRSSTSVSGTNKSETHSSNLPQLSFNRLQPSDELLGIGNLKHRNFGRFVAREAVLDEEYWTTAWLRAEAHWEALPYTRHVDNYKRKYAEEEFYALKRRCLRQDGNSVKCFCFVSVKKEDKTIRRTVLNSVVGTLDLSIRQFLQGETYPGEGKRHSTLLPSHGPFDANKYAYVANVCVSKFARRQGIASNMLYMAIDVASLAGTKRLFVHVNVDNTPAQELYKKTGFKVFLKTYLGYTLEVSHACIMLLILTLFLSLSIVYVDLSCCILQEF